MQDPGPFLPGSHKGGYGTVRKGEGTFDRQEGRRAKRATGARRPRGPGRAPAVTPPLSINGVPARNSRSRARTSVSRSARKRGRPPALARRRPRGRGAQRAERRDAVEQIVSPAPPPSAFRQPPINRPVSSRETRRVLVAALVQVPEVFRNRSLSMPRFAATRCRRRARVYVASTRRYPSDRRPATPPSPDTPRSPGTHRQDDAAHRPTTPTR